MLDEEYIRQQALAKQQTQQLNIALAAEREEMMEAAAAAAAAGHGPDMFVPPTAPRRGRSRRTTVPMEALPPELGGLVPGRATAATDPDAVDAIAANLPSLPNLQPKRRGRKAGSGSSSVSRLRSTPSGPGADTQLMYAASAASGLLPELSTAAAESSKYSNDPISPTAYYHLPLHQQYNQQLQNSQGFFSPGSALHYPHDASLGTTGHSMYGSGPQPQYQYHPYMHTISTATPQVASTSYGQYLSQERHSPTLGYAAEAFPETIEPPIKSAAPKTQGREDCNVDENRAINVQ